jgi:hypothetical protein
MMAESTPVGFALGVGTHAALLYAGGKAGAAVGSMGGPVGTVVGAMVGAVGLDLSAMIGLIIFNDRHPG